MQNAIIMNTKAVTARLPDELRQDAEIYAERAGLTLNGLMCVALRQFLDREFGVLMGASLAVSAEVAVQEPVKVPRKRAVAVDDGEQQGALRLPPPGALAVPPHGNRRAPCPCGSKLRWKDCHGKEVAV